MDGSKYEKRVLTLYGVIQAAMEAGKSFAELRHDVKEWMEGHHGSHYVCTVVKKSEYGYLVVARYHVSHKDMVSLAPYKFCDVPVPDTYLDKVEARHREQCW